ncbi:hypothetical protein QBC37DRAFT_377595 [Rhypophila decipiens]|uniref:Uncharacterized protein n=1 Tax=Rhypophila decipiens TaxID=261697 RepID=A0AAN7B4Q5_9PEZI|nr:hypothetical protein QBC37DRAFT_377595 [Rhypophila decipiens]
MAPPRSMVVLGQPGAGKRTLVGSILYKLGIDLSLLQRLERETGRKYPDIVAYFDKNNLIKSFHSPSGTIIIHDYQSEPDHDLTLWVVNGASDDRGASSSAELKSLIADGLKTPKRQLLIVVNQMDLVDWSEEIFHDVAQNFRGAPFEETRTSIVPISALDGDNMLEAPERILWGNGETLLEAIG